MLLCILFFALYKAFPCYIDAAGFEGVNDLGISCIGQCFEGGLFDPS